MRFDPHDAARLDRRTFLRVAGSAGAGIPLLLSACTLANPLTSRSTSQAANASSSQSTPGSLRLQLPTYTTGRGPTADYPAAATGLQAGYLRYPGSPVKSVPQPPGLGGDVDVLVSTASPPPPAVDQNPAWQAINKELNVNMKLNIVATGPDYTTRIQTTMAGNDLPDMLF